MDDESALIERAKTDKEAFGELYELYAERIYKYIYYRTSNHAETEDLTSRVFERALKHISHYENRGVPFSAWLYRIAHNLVANYHRDRSRRQLISLESISQWHIYEDGPELAIETDEDKETLLRAVHRLPADRRDLLLMKYVEKMPNAEIGDIMGRSEGAIKSLYHRTLLALRAELGKNKGSAPKRRSFSRRQG